MIKFKQLTALDRDNVNCFQIAELTWRTDPFIYPAICTAENIDLIEELYRAGSDRMFSLDNTFVAEGDAGSIEGIVVWKRGPLFWNSQQLRSLAAEKGRTLSSLLPLAEDHYFSSYRNVPNDTTSLINVCVSEQKQGMGIGTAMLREFLKLHQGESLELFCLTENLSAIKLYQRAGFEIVKTIPAFAPETEEQILCHQMIKKK